jgi:hypothetical protein
MILGWSSPRSHPLGVLGPSQALVLYICIMCTRLACGHGPGMALNLGPMWTRIGSLCSYPCLY